jgi:hypothetical protein
MSRARWKTQPVAQGQQRYRLVRTFVGLDPSTFDQVRDHATASGRSFSEAAANLIAEALNARSST